MDSVLSQFFLHLINIASIKSTQKATSNNQSGFLKYLYATYLVFYDRAYNYKQMEQTSIQKEG